MLLFPKVELKQKKSVQYVCVPNNFCFCFWEHIQTPLRLFKSGGAKGREARPCFNSRELWRTTWQVGSSYMRLHVCFRLVCQRQSRSSSFLRRRLNTRACSEEKYIPEHPLPSSHFRFSSVIPFQGSFAQPDRFFSFPGHPLGRVVVTRAWPYRSTTGHRSSEEDIIIFEPNRFVSQYFVGFRAS